MVMEPVPAPTFGITVTNIELTQSSTFFADAGSPPRLELTTIRADQTRLHSSAIYDLRGDSLTYCIAAPGYPRPTGFETRKDDGRTLVTLKRMEP
jgi:uncharacterized protein (TIGR03067 family)